MSKIPERLGMQNKATVIRISFWLAVLIGIIDYIAGPEISLSIFYLLPVALAAWFAGLLWGFGVALFCAVTWFLADMLSGHSYSHQAIGFWAAGMKLGYFLIVAALLGALNKLLAERKLYTTTDSLTGLANTKGFYQLAEIELKKARRYNYPLTFAYIDLDNFKKINDLFGHSTGDSVLQFIAQAIKRDIRPGDWVGRLGGDEFCILMPQTDRAAAKSAFDHLRNNLLESMQSNRWSITFSIGVITFTVFPAEIDDMVIKVNHLMSSVKNNGKNMIKYEEFSDKAMLV